MKQLIAICGLDCEKCDCYIATDKMRLFIIFEV